MTKVSTNSKMMAAAVLSGGRSSRMGRDKSMLRFRGKTLTALLAEKLLKAGFKPVLVVGPRKKYGLPQSVKVIRERHWGKGPLSGIEAALRAAHSSCLVVPCDLPFISAASLKKFGRVSKGRLAAVAENPLPAVFPLEILGRIQKNIREGKLALFPILKKAVPIKGISKRQLFNMNDPQSLKIVRSDKKVARF